MKLLLIVSGLFFIMLYKDCYCQDDLLKNEFTFMFYNVENFFDCENDSLTNDDEYTPEGNRRWIMSRLHTKAERLAKVILASGKWNPPVFVGLCEIENLHVLELLTQHAPLNKYSYRVVQKDSPDERGIDVALIYRPELFRPFDYQAIPVVDPIDQSFRTRDILRVSGVLNGCDTLHLFVNHWPSRYGGIMETIRYRRLAAETLKKSIQSLNATFSGAKIICMGDFNDTPKDESLVRVFDAKEYDNPQIKGEMINLSFRWLSNTVQTIKSQYTWEVFDQWIVSDSFLESKDCFKFLNAEIFNASFLLEPDAKFGGVKPKRTYVGFKYHEGFSDHLPVLIRVQIQDY
ncbi:MAG TPA: endonuclease [Prolixibacteraceae bacterium]|nr:endonuclease [Prolixibacteraceae bacterium]